MDKEKLKSYLWLIAITIGMVLVAIHFEKIVSGIGFIIELLIPLFVGIAIAFILNRPYEWFRRILEEKCRIKPNAAKVIAVFSVYFAAVGAVALLLRLIVPELIQNIKLFAESVDVYLRNIQENLNVIMDGLGLRHIDMTKLIDTVDQYLGTLSKALDETLRQIINITSGVFSVLANAFISVALSIYLLAGKEKLLSQVKRIVGAYLAEKYSRKAEGFSKIVIQVFEDYVAGQCKEAVILGLLCFVGMIVLRLEYAGLISVIIGVTALIPILGAYLGAAIGILLLLFISPGKALLFLVFIVVLQQIEGNVIYPRVVGRKIGLPGIWVLLGISVGGGILGILGMVIAVPVTTILYQLLKKDVKRREERRYKADIPDQEKKPQAKE